MNTISSQVFSTDKKIIPTIAFSDIFKRYSIENRHNLILKANIIAWIIISYIYYGIIFGYNSRINDNNKLDFKLHYIILNLLLDIFCPYIVGFIATYFSTTYIISTSFAIIAISTISTDWTNISYSKESIAYFGASFEKDSVSNFFNYLSLEKFCIIIIHSLFEILTLTKVPTLYRS